MTTLFPKFFVLAQYHARHRKEPITIFQSALRFIPTAIRLSNVSSFDCKEAFFPTLYPIENNTMESCSLRFVKQQLVSTKFEPEKQRLYKNIATTETV